MEGADTPSTARMIDYWLGGDNHFPVDVTAAQAFESVYGPCAHEFRALRAFLGRSVQHLVRHGLADFLVFGAGVPTLGNVHEVAPDAHVLYTDIDPVIVAYGQRILGAHPTAAYTQGDATDLATIDPDVLRRVLPGWGNRPAGVVFLGLAAFLDDARLAKAFDDLYDATLPGSRMAFDFDSDVLTHHPQALAMMGPGFHMRDPSCFGHLTGRWQVTDEGIRPVAHWGVPDAPPDGGQRAAFYGGVAVR
jgi:hypothetical protein